MYLICFLTFGVGDNKIWILFLHKWYFFSFWKLLEYFSFWPSALKFCKHVGLLKVFVGDFPGGPRVKNLPSNAKDANLIPGWGTKILHAASPHATTREAWKQLRPDAAKHIYIVKILGKESAWSAGDLGLIPGLGRSPGGAHGNSFPYSCLENPQARIVDISLKVLMLFAS